MNFFDRIIDSFSNPFTAIAQIIGIFPFIICSFRFLFDDRRKVLFYKMLSDALSSLHLLLLGEMTGAALNLISAIRGYVFSHKGKKWASGLHIPILFCCINLLSTIMTWSGIKSLFPCVGSTLVIVGFWCNDIRLVRRINFCGIILWLIYGIMAGSISTILSTTFSATSVLTAEIKDRIKQKKRALEIQQL